jgi:hypothetical protein
MSTFIYPSSFNKIVFSGNYAYLLSHNNAFSIENKSVWRSPTNIESGSLVAILTSSAIKPGSFGYITSIVASGTDLYIGDIDQASVGYIRKYNQANGVLTTVAGGGVAPAATGVGDGIGTAAYIGDIRGMWISGNVIYFCEASPHYAVRKFNIETSAVDLVCGTAIGFGFGTKLSRDWDGAGGTNVGFAQPYGIWGDDNFLYVTDLGQGGTGGSIRKINKRTTATTMTVGTGSAGHLDSTGTLARFFQPYSLSGTATHLYLVDTGNNCIRTVSVATSATLTTVGSGSGIGAGNVDGTGSTARMHSPYGPAGNASDFYLFDAYGLKKVNITTNSLLTLSGNVLANGNPHTLALSASTLFLGKVYSSNQAIGLHPGAVIFKVPNLTSGSAFLTATVGQVSFGKPLDFPNNLDSAFYPKDIAINSSGNIAVVGFRPPAQGPVIWRGVTPTGTFNEMQLYGINASFPLLSQSCESVTVAFGDKFIVTIQSGTYNGIKVVSSSRGTGGAGIFDWSECDSITQSLGAGTRLSSSNYSIVGASGSVFYNYNIGEPFISNGYVRKSSTGHQSSWTNSFNAWTATNGPGANGDIHQIGLASFNNVVYNAFYTSLNATFSQSEGIWIDDPGTYAYVADTGNHVIRKLNLLTGETSVFIGSASQAGSTNDTGSLARFNGPTGIWGNSGSLWVSDTNNNAIRRIDLNTTSSILWLGSAVGTPGTANGTTTTARFNKPRGLWANGTDLFIADTNSHTIRKAVLGTGVVTTVVGAGGITGTLDASSTTARLHSATAVWGDSTNLYIADTNNHTIRKTPIAGGWVNTIAGNPGHANFNDGLASGSIRFGPSSSFFASGLPGADTWGSPGAMWIDTAGTFMYVCDPGAHTIRKIRMSDGTSTTFAGMTNVPGTDDLVGTLAKFNTPYAITGNATHLYVGDSLNYTVRKIDISTGAVTTFIGSGTISGFTPGTGSAARITSPTGLAISGNMLYVADYNDTVWKANLTTGAVAILYGSGTNEFQILPGTGSAGRLNRPTSVFIDPTTVYLYIGCRGTGQGGIVKVHTSSSAGDFASAPTNAPIGGITAFSGNMYYCAVTNNVSNVFSSINKVNNYASYNYPYFDSPGTIGLAGAINVLDHIDGSGSIARFGLPWQLTNDGTYIYVADGLNRCIRRMTQDGFVTTWAGGRSNIFTSSMEGTGSSTGFSFPRAITGDSQFLYVADNNHFLRRVHLTYTSGTTAIVAGRARDPGFSDGLSTQAQFHSSSALFNYSGTFYVTDRATNIVRKIINSNSVGTVFGVVNSSGSLDQASNASKYAVYLYYTDDAGTTWNRASKLDTAIKMSHMSLDSNGRVLFYGKNLTYIYNFSGNTAGEKYWKSFSVAPPYDNMPLEPTTFAVTGSNPVNNLPKFFYTPLLTGTMISPSKYFLAKVMNDSTNGFQRIKQGGQTNIDNFSTNQGINFRNEFAKKIEPHRGTVSSKLGNDYIIDSANSTIDADHYDGFTKHLTVKGILAPPNETLLFASGAKGASSGRTVISDIIASNDGTFYAAGYTQTSSSFVTYKYGVNSSSFILKSTDKGNTWTIFTVSFMKEIHGLYKTPSPPEYIWYFGKGNSDIGQAEYFDPNSVTDSPSNPKIGVIPILNETSSIHAAVMDLTGNLFLGGTRNKGRGTVGGTLSASTWIILSRSYDYGVYGTVDSVETTVLNSESCVYSMSRFNHVATSSIPFFLYAAGTQNGSGLVKAASSSMGSSTVVGATGTWNNTFTTTPSAGVIYSIFGDDDVVTGSIAGEDPRIYYGYILGKQRTGTHGKYYWRFSRFTHTDVNIISNIEYITGSDNGASAEPRKLIKDTKNRILYALGGWVDKSGSSFTDSNRWTIRKSYFNNSPSGSHGVFNSAYTFISVVNKPTSMVSRPFIFDDSTNRFSDCALAMGGMVYDDVLYVGGVASGSLQGTDPNISATINTGVIYKYEHNSPASPIPFSSSRGITNIMELYPRFVDANNVEIKSKDLFRFLSSGIGNQTDFYLKIVIASSSAMTIAELQNFYIGFRDNYYSISVASGGLAATAPTNYKEITAFSNVYLSGGKAIYESSFISGSGFYTPAINLNNQENNGVLVPCLNPMLIFSSSNTGSYTIEEISLKFKQPLSNDGVKSYRDIDNQNNVEISDYIKRIATVVE